MSPLIDHIEFPQGPSFTEVLIHLSTELEGVAREHEGARVTHERARTIRHQVRQAFSSVGAYSLDSVLREEDRILVLNYLSAEDQGLHPEGWRIAARGIEICHLVRGRIASFLHEDSVQNEVMAVPVPDANPTGPTYRIATSDGSTITLDGSPTINWLASNGVGDATITFTRSELMDIDEVRPTEPDHGPRPRLAQVWRD